MTDDTGVGPGSAAPVVEVVAGPGVEVRTPHGAWCADGAELLWWAPGEATPRAVAARYADVAREGERVVGTVVLRPAAGCVVEVRDVWVPEGDAVALVRETTVRGGLPGGFAVRVGLVRTVGVAGQTFPAHGWADVEAYAPGVVLGRAGPVSDWTLAGPATWRGEVRDVLVREDRMSAPHLSVRYADDVALTLLRRDGTAVTVAADGAEERGGTVVDERVDLAALGAVRRGGGLAVGAVYPAAEGERTYTSGGLPLVGANAWRATLHPLRDGLRSSLGLVLAVSHDRAPVDLLTRVRRRAWEEYRPHVEPVRAGAYVLPVATVLASQVRRGARGLSGIGLESDPRTGSPVGEPLAVMGFVGANTDAALCLLRAARVAPAEQADRLRARGVAVLDSFADLAIDPPAGEGWHLATGRPVTYRMLDGAPAVYLRAVAEGCHAALRAADLPEADPVAADRWRRWALRGGRFLLRQQRPDGSFPRCWRAGTDEVLSPSPTATGTALRFLCALAPHEPAALPAALAAGGHVWRTAGDRLAYAGATLDNPDVVDKEAAILASEGFLGLFRLTGERRWLDRASHAARVAESWVHLTDLPVPVDAPVDGPHWKPGRSVVGMQLITSGVTMSDGFLSVNAAHFVELTLLTGQEWPARVARLVHHGSKAMLATAQDPLDLAGPGWQQEHWGLGPRRGYGLNRHWLPWAAVAVLDGWARLIDLGPAARELAGLDG